MTPIKKSQSDSPSPLLLNNCNQLKHLKIIQRPPLQQEQQMSKSSHKHPNNNPNQLPPNKNHNKNHHLPQFLSHLTKN
jgi:hypothetical protein